MYRPLSLTPPQNQVLALISAGSSISEAAQSAGVHRNTVHNWIHSQPHFSLALAGARECKALFWREEAQQLAAAAIDTIRNLMTQASTPAGVRLKAAHSILELAMAPPPEPQSPSLFDLMPNLVVDAPGETVSESVASPHSAQSSAAAASTPQPPAERSMHNSAQSVRRPSSKVGRNDICPCGSGKKFKRCCLNSDEPVLAAVA